MNSRMLEVLLGLAGAIGALLLWQLASGLQVFGTAFPSAVDTLSRLGTLLAAPETWQATGETLLTAVTGLLIAIGIGIVGGILIGTTPVLEHATRVPLEFLKPIPAIVVLPIAVLVFGPKPQMGIFLVAFGCTIQILIQTANGVINTDPIALDTARSYQMGRLERLARIVLPSATPAIVSAIRIGAPTSLVIAIVSELFGGAPGLGQTLYLMMKVVDREGVFAVVLLLGLLGLIVLWSSSAAERRVIHWHTSIREGRQA